jgi:hypothetical protein
VKEILTKIQWDKVHSGQQRWVIKSDAMALESVEVPVLSSILVESPTFIGDPWR